VSGCGDETGKPAGVPYGGPALNSADETIPDLSGEVAAPSAALDATSAVSVRRASAAVHTYVRQRGP
jgi:hypothetical protein